MENKIPYIVLLDPASNPFDNSTANVGDQIIYKYVSRILFDIFPQFEIIRIPIHQPITFRSRELIKKAAYTFVGGSNAFISNINRDKRLNLDKKYFQIFPDVKNIIFLGIGSSGYHKSPFLTRLYYQMILSKKYLHSFRDKESQSLFNTISPYFKSIYTTCPTLWFSDKQNLPFNDSIKNVIVTLTSYNQDVNNDTFFIQKILEKDKIVYFFPQNKADSQYLATLEIYQKNKQKFFFLDSNLPSLEDLLSNQNADFNYIGTRLHGGIECLNHHIPSLILSIDGRAKEIGKDNKLTVAHRTDNDSITDWFNNKLIINELDIPFESINTWKQQFNN